MILLKKYELKESYIKKFSLHYFEGFDASSKRKEFPSS